MIYRKEDYLEENEQDQRFPVKRIEVLIPISGGPKIFSGHVVLGMQTPMGMQQLPVSFEIAAETVEDAFQKFGVAAEPRIEEVKKSIEAEINRMRQEQSSRIVTPGQAGFGGGGGGGNVIDFNRLKE